MRRIFDHILCTLSIMAVICMTSFVAYASGQATAVGQTELCTGHGAVIVHFDADGNIVTVDPGCPDCAMDYLAGIDPITRMPMPCATFTAHMLQIEAIYLRTSAQVTAKARAPPFVI